MLRKLLEKLWKRLDYRVFAIRIVRGWIQGGELTEDNLKAVRELAKKCKDPNWELPE